MIGIETRFFMNVRVDNLSLDAALEGVETLLLDSRRDGVPREVFFANVHSIHLARKDREFRNFLNRADLVLPDGSGLNLAGRVLDMPIMQNLNGTDFTPKVCRMAEVGGWSVYLLGARREVVERCYHNLSKRYAHLELAGYHDGYFSEEDEGEIIRDINRAAPDLLLVALGSPRQEKWIARHAMHLNVGVCFAVGGLFDFMSNERARAPLWVRNLGMEWLFRFLQEPKGKWPRIFVEIPVFLSMVYKNRFSAIMEQIYQQRLKFILNGQKNRYVRS